MAVETLLALSSLEYKFRIGGFSHKLLDVVHAFLIAFVHLPSQQHVVELERLKRAAKLSSECSRCVSRRKRLYPKEASVP